MYDQLHLSQLKLCIVQTIFVKIKLLCGDTRPRFALAGCLNFKKGGKLRRFQPRNSKKCENCEKFGIVFFEIGIHTNMDFTTKNHILTVAGIMDL